MSFKIFKTTSRENPQDRRVFAGRVDASNMAVKAGRFHTWRKAPMGPGEATHAVNPHNGTVYRIKYVRSV